MIQLRAIIRGIEIIYSFIEQIVIEHLLGTRQSGRHVIYVMRYNTLIFLMFTLWFHYLNI